MHLVCGFLCVYVAVVAGDGFDGGGFVLLAGLCCVFSFGVFVGSELYAVFVQSYEFMVVAGLRFVGSTQLLECTVGAGLAACLVGWRFVSCNPFGFCSTAEPHFAV